MKCGPLLRQLTLVMGLLVCVGCTPYITNPRPVAYQNDVLGVQVKDTLGLRVFEAGMLANDSTWGFALVKDENGGNGALVLSVSLVYQAPPNVNQAAAKLIATYPLLPIQQVSITVDGRSGKMLFPLPGINGATYIYLAVHQHLYQILYAAETLDATGQALLRQLHFIQPTRTLASLHLKRAADEPIGAAAAPETPTPKVTQQPKPLTLYEAWDIAQAYAQAWRKDAALLSLISTDVNDPDAQNAGSDGRRRSWQAAFTSPSLNKQLFFQITDGVIMHATEDGAHDPGIPTLTAKPVIDSPAALQRVKMRQPNFAFSVGKARGIQFMLQTLPTGEPSFTIIGPAKTAKGEQALLSFNLDPQTGQIVSAQELAPSVN